MRASLAGLGSLLAALSLATPAAADTFDKKATAWALFEHGRALIQRGDFAEACPELAESLRLDQGIGTMLWLADCWENTSRTASAWAMFKEAAAVAALEKDPRERVARRRAAELEPLLTRVVVLVPKAAMLPGLDIERDGVSVTAPQIGVPIPVDPGRHRFTATAPGHERWSSTIDVRARARAVALTVPLLAEDHDGARGSLLRTTAVVLAGAGVVAAGVGAFAGFRAKTVYARSGDDGHCIADRCDAIGTDARNTASQLAMDSRIAFAVAGAALVSGGVLWLVAPSRSPGTGSLAVVPTFGVGQAAVYASRSF